MSAPRNRPGPDQRKAVELARAVASGDAQAAQRLAAAVLAQAAARQAARKPGG